MTCGDRQINQVLGGGLVPGQVTLLAGEPGIGKSTLVLQMLADLLGAGRDCLLVAGEESQAQIAARGARLGREVGRLPVVAATSVQAILETCARERPQLLVVDSVQTLVDESFEQPAGSVTQVREAAASLAAHAKRTGCAVLLTGHVTKDGSVAGPKTLEHLVDSVLVLEGERSGTLRMLRSMKNRYGSCDELAIFLMTGVGLTPVPDPSALLMADRITDAPGSVVFPSLEGSRAVLVEVQGLVSDKPAAPRVVTLGVDARRAAVGAAVLAKRLELDIAGREMFVAAAGGLSVTEPAADLSVCLALASSFHDTAVDASTAVIGEVGLVGELRRVPGIERRLSEARRLGFARAIVPEGQGRDVGGIDVVGVADLKSAFRAAIARSSGHASREADRTPVLT